ncbi:hypothetical protein ACOME3_003249 [Neoechinorhynchus agilis]
MQMALLTESVSHRNLQKSLMKLVNENALSYEHIDQAIGKIKPSLDSADLTSFLSLVIHYVPKGLSIIIINHRDLIDRLCSCVCEKEHPIEKEMKLLVQLCLRSNPQCASPLQLDACDQCSLDTMIAGATLFVHHCLVLNSERMIESARKRLNEPDLGRAAHYAICFAIVSQSDHATIKDIVYFAMDHLFKFNSRPNTPITRLLFTMSLAELSNLIVCLECDDCIFRSQLVTHFVKEVSNAFWSGLEHRIEVERTNIEHAYGCILKKHSSQNCRECGLSDELRISRRKRFVERYNSPTRSIRFYVCGFEESKAEIIDCCHIYIIIRTHGPQIVHDIYPDLVEQSLIELCDRAAAKQLSGLYATLSRSLNDDTIAIERVLKPIIAHYNRTSQKILICQLVAPELLKTKPCPFARYLISLPNQDEFAAFVTLSLVTLSDSNPTNEILEGIDERTIETSLQSPSLIEKADAFKLICKLRPTIERTDIILRFLENECHMTEAHLRNQFVVNIEKLMRRLRSMNAKKCPSKDVYLVMSLRLWDFIVNECLIDSTYSQRNFGLRVLSVLLQPIHHTVIPSKYLEVLNEILLITSMDSYEDNRSIAIRLLGCTPNKLSSEERSRVFHQLKSHLRIVRCPRRLECISEALAYFSQGNKIDDIIEVICAESFSGNKFEDVTRIAH